MIILSKMQSDLSGASQKATELQQAVNLLSNASTITLDTQTTVSGNSNAQDIIQKSQSTAQQITEAITTASNNIKSVATEFEAVDQKGSNLFDLPFGLGK